MTHELTYDIAIRFAETALGHVTRPWPYKVDHVMTGPGDVGPPRELHPIFFGSFDWHSCVHGHWTLARIRRRFPNLPLADEIGRLFDAQFTGKKIEGELDYLARPASRGFERPYGWGWLLMLTAELSRHRDAKGREWAQRLSRLALAFAGRFRQFLPLADYPVRAGAHTNTAFALILAREYARVSGDTDLGTLCDAKARAWYGADAGCQAWEPSQDDFLSPALTEAALLAQVLPEAEFRSWFAAFLPQAASREPGTLFTPARVSDRTDGKIAHLDGLNLSRAWCWRLIAERLDKTDAVRALAETAIAEHLDSALAHVTGDYMGEHWLASFALLALDPVP
jgi:hypothetical protein